MTYTVVALGLFLAIMGLWGVHKSTIDTKKIFRTVSVLLTMSGVLFLWLAAATKSPVVVSVISNVVEVSKNHLVTTITAETARNCKLEKVDVALVLTHGGEISVDSDFEPNAVLGNKSLGTLTLNNTSDYTPVGYKLKFHHQCIYGLYVESATSTYPLPNNFNK